MIEQWIPASPVAGLGNLLQLASIAAALA